MKKKESSGKKALIIIICIILSLVIFCFAVFPFLIMLWIEEFDEDAQKHVGKPIKIADVETFAEYETFFKESEIIEVEAYWTPDGITILGVTDDHISGNLLVTEEYYNEIKNSYDDWQLTSGLRSYSPWFGFEELLSDADSSFIEFTQSNEYYYSETYIKNNNYLVLLSKDENRLCFYNYTL